MNGQIIQTENQQLNSGHKWKLDQINLTDLYRTFHPNASDTFFSSVHGPFSRIHHVSGHKIILNKFKRMEISSRIFSDHSDIKLEVNCKKKAGKITNMWKLNNMLLNNCLVNKKPKEILNIPVWKWKHNELKFMRCNRSGT